MWYRISKRPKHIKIKKMLDDNEPTLVNDGPDIKDITVPDSVSPEVPMLVPQKPQAPLPDNKDLPPMVLPKEDKPFLNKPLVPQSPPEEFIPQEPIVSPEPISQQKQPEDPDLKDSETLPQPEELPITDNVPRYPRLHLNCHCEVRTMPGGRRIWDTGPHACPQCAQARDNFNASQAAAFGI